MQSKFSVTHQNEHVENQIVAETGWTGSLADWLTDWLNVGMKGRKYYIRSITIHRIMINYYSFVNRLYKVYAELYTIYVYVLINYALVLAILNL